MIFRPLIVLCAAVLLTPVIAGDPGGGGSFAYAIGNETLTAWCGDIGECRIAINAEEVDRTFFHHGDAESFVEPLRGTDEALFLLNLEHGDGCPAMYALVHLIDETHHRVSEPFGNCNEWTTVEHKGEGVVFRFPGFEEAGRRAEAYFYSFEERRITPLVGR